MSAIVEVYRNVGHRVKSDVMKCTTLGSKQKKLLERMEAIEHSGTVCALITKD